MRVFSVFFNIHSRICQPLFVSFYTFFIFFGALILLQYFYIRLIYIIRSLLALSAKLSSIINAVKADTLKLIDFITARFPRGMILLNSHVHVALLGS